MKYTIALLTITVICLLGALLSKRESPSKPLSESDQVAASWRAFVDGVRGDLLHAQYMATTNQPSGTFLALTIVHDDARRSDSITSPYYSDITIKELSGHTEEDSSGVSHHVAQVTGIYKFSWVDGRWRYLEYVGTLRWPGPNENRFVVKHGPSDLADWEKFLFRNAL